VPPLDLCLRLQCFHERPAVHPLSCDVNLKTKKRKGAKALDIPPSLPPCLLLSLSLPLSLRLDDLSFGLIVTDPVLVCLPMHRHARSLSIRPSV